MKNAGIALFAQKLKSFSDEDSYEKIFKAFVKSSQTRQTNEKQKISKLALNTLINFEQKRKCSGL